MRTLSALRQRTRADLDKRAAVTSKGRGPVSAAGVIRDRAAESVLTNHIAALAAITLFLAAPGISYAQEHGQHEHGQKPEDTAHQHGSVPGMRMRAAPGEPSLTFSHSREGS